MTLLFEMKTEAIKLVELEKRRDYLVSCLEETEGSTERYALEQSIVNAEYNVARQEGRIEIIKAVHEKIQVFLKNLKNTIKEGINRNDVLPLDWCLDRIDEQADKSFTVCLTKVEDGKGNEDSDRMPQEVCHIRDESLGGHNTQMTQYILQEALSNHFIEEGDKNFSLYTLKAVALECANASRKQVITEAVNLIGHKINYLLGQAKLNRELKVYSLALSQESKAQILEEVEKEILRL